MKKLSLFALVLSTSVYATTYDYVDDPNTGYDSNGKPLTMTNINSALPADILDNIYLMLPESTPVNPAFIAPDTASNISIDPDLETFATATVTFLNEGAGYRNSLGYFVYDTNNPPASKADIPTHTIIFPNASKPSAGSMAQGDTVELGIQLFAGQTLGFFLVPNGWSYNGSGSTIQNDGPWNTPFYSLAGLNPEAAHERRHNVVFVDPVSELVVYGFDDQFIPEGDFDYNDLLYSVKITPFVAIDGVNPDGSVDGDFITLGQDVGEDEEIVSYYPTQNGYATMMFEDLWPLEGDFDFNDFIIKYRLRQTLGAQNSVKRIEATYMVQAHGAGYHNGFSLRLPGVDKSNVESVSLTKNGVAVAHTIIEAAANDTVLMISPNLQGDIMTSCGFFRTYKLCHENINLTYQLDVVLTTAVSPSVIGQAPYDPFLFAVNGTYHGMSFFGLQPGRKWEVHQKHFSGTNLFETAYFNLDDDASNGTYHYLNIHNIPWVINITDTFDHPAEGWDIRVVYDEFDDWVTSGGFSFTDWYLRSKADLDKLYE